MVAPASRFSNTADTGIRVSRNTQAPLSLAGTLSTAGHWDQSSVAMFRLSFIVALYHGSATVSRAGMGNMSAFGKGVGYANEARLPALIRACTSRLRAPLRYTIVEAR